MMIHKAVTLPFPFGRTDFLIIEEDLRHSDTECITQRSLYLADAQSPGGMKLIKRGDAYWTMREGLNVFPPVRVPDAVLESTE